MAAPTPPTGVGWDTTSPGIGEPQGNDYKELQELKLALSLRLVKEHVAFGVTTAGGEHKPGSAISYFGDFSASAAGDALPTRRPDATAPWTSGGTALTAADYGRLAYDSDAVFGGILWVYLAAGWTKVGYMDILTAQTIAGVKTFSVSPIVPTPTTDMQVSTKKYVDDYGKTIGAFSDSYETVTISACIQKTGFSTAVTGNLSGTHEANQVTFATAFPNGILSVFCQVSQANGYDQRIDVTVYDLATTGFKFNLVEDFGGNNNVLGVYWFAIGR
jgi:hypothetical protein